MPSMGIGSFLRSLVPSKRGYGGDLVASHTVTPSTNTRPPHRRVKAGVGFRIISGNLDTLEHNTDLEASNWYGSPDNIGIAQQMVKDSHVRQSLKYRGNPIRAGLWEVVPGGKRPVDIEAAEFLNWTLIETQNFDAILQNVLNFHRDGHSILETTDAVIPIPMDRFPLHKGRGLGIAITGMHHVPAWTIDEAGWKPNKLNARELQAFTQHVSSKDGITFESALIDVGKNLIVRFTQEQEGANYIGFPTARSAFGPWKVKLVLTVIDAIKHERWGLGVPWGKLPANWSEDDRVALEDSLADFRANAKGYFVTPEGYEIEMFGSKDDDGTNINESIERCDQAIFLNVGAQFALLGAAKFGSHALAQTIEGQFGLGIIGDTKFVEGGFNHGVDGWSTVKRYTKLNYPDAATPNVRVRNLPIHDYAAILKAVAEQIKVGGIVRDDDLELAIREKVFMPIPTNKGARRPKDIDPEENKDNVDA